MGASAYLEVDSGDWFNIYSLNGFNVGKALIGFLGMLSTYEEILDKTSPEYDWYRRFESQSPLNLNILSNAVYSGDWDFLEHEYERFKKCAKDNPFKNEDEFRRGMQELYDLWTPIESAIEATNEIIKIFKNMSGEDYWFTSTDVENALQGLRDTLLLAMERNGKESEIRIKGE